MPDVRSPLTTDIKTVYHLAEAANWPTIERCGLKCAAELLAESGLGATQRRRYGREQRPSHTTLPNGVQIRDQRPMPRAALAGCVKGMSPEDWYALINTHVFFWLDPERLDRQRQACEPRPQMVLTFDAAELMATHRDRVFLTPINTGSARRRPAVRGAASFVPLQTWATSGWNSEAKALGTTPRARSQPPAEFTIVGSLPDAMRFVLRVTPLAAGESFQP
jgi:hypothetical protein